MTDSSTPSTRPTPEDLAASQNGDAKDRLKTLRAYVDAEWNRARIAHE